MALDLTGLPSYSQEDKMELIRQTLWGAKTAGLMKSQTGIKTSAKLNILTGTATFQAGGSCSFTSSGTTTLTQRTLTVGSIAEMEAFCPKDLEQKWTQELLDSGSKPEELPFADMIVAEKIEKIAQALEVAIWQGDTASGTANLARFDGLAKIIKAATTEVIATAQADVTSATIRGIVENIYSLVPANSINADDLRLFMGWDNYRTLLMKLTADNLFHYTADEAAKTGEMFYPGTTLKIIATHGLNGTDEMYCLRLSNMYKGVDMDMEEAQFSLEYAPEARQVRFISEFKFGVQVAFPDQIVRYQNS